MEIYTIDERPLALRAACAQVPGAPMTTALTATAPMAAVPMVAFATGSAHVSVGGGVAKGAAAELTGIQAQQIQLSGQRSTVQGINGLVVKDYPTVKPVGGLRGVPPREKPV